MKKQKINKVKTLNDEAKSEVVVDLPVSKPKWYIEPLGKDKVYHGCLHCGGTEQTLALSTRLYNSFGGWMITKDDELYFEETDRNKDFYKNKTLRQIEKEASKDPDHDWRAVFDLPLRGGEYQRHGKNKWVLISSNQGFA